MNELRRLTYNPARFFHAGLAGIALAIVLAFGGVSNAFGQATITGRVVDQGGQPMVGAEVFFPRLQLGTVTDAQGDYRLVIPEARLTGGEATLVARSLGYRSQSATVALREGDQTHNFRLPLDPLEQEAIVARGEGFVTERQRIASTINTVTAENVNATQETNVIAALAGKAPNVEVTSSSGDPGAGAFIRIRGSGTLQGVQPLIVVDGVPYSNTSVAIGILRAQAPALGSGGGTVMTNRAMDINPADIESIDILKGAAASSIYGARAGNGVIIITTKSGRKNTSQMSYKISTTWDEVNQVVPLQRQFGQGLDRAAVGLPDPAVGASNVSWGPPLAPGTPTFDHARDIHKTGWTVDQDVQLSGGSDRTTYFMSVGRTDQEGILRGNSSMQKTTFRIKGSHDFTEDFVASANMAYAQTDLDLIQMGSNVNGVMLAALRTPPEFNNLPYRDPETGGHRSYQCFTATCTGSLTASRVYDNPFWVLNENPNTSQTGRVTGGANLEYEPLPWLNLGWTGGVDYWSDERFSMIPKSSAGTCVIGCIARANYVNWIGNSTVRGTVTRDLTEDIRAAVVLGYNMNQTEFRQIEAYGQNVLAGAEQLDFAVTVLPDEFVSKIKTDGILLAGNVDLHNQLYLEGGVRWDASSTFGREDARFAYPNAQVSWIFTENPGIRDNLGWLDFGKVRFAYGRVGVQPPIFSNLTDFVTGNFSDGGWGPSLFSIYRGLGGVATQVTRGNPEIRPEETEEYEAGFDLGFLDNRVGFSVVHYQRFTDQVILTLPIPASTGFTFKQENGAKIENKGWEATLDVRPVTGPNFAWEVGLQWGRNESCVTDLLGTDRVGIGNNFFGAANSLVQPRDVDGDGEPDPDHCFEYGVLWGSDFVRFGRGETVTIAGETVRIDDAFPGTPEGTLYIGANGFPRQSGRDWVIGNPNPQWTGSIRNTVTLFNKLRASGLIDVKHGGDMWNGTRGALVHFGTHESTIPMQGAGQPHVFEGVGHGAGQQVMLNWQTWANLGIGSGFNGPTSQFIEEASFVKLRDVSLSYTFDQPFVRTIGFNSLDVRFSGRNLKTWTDYTGIDPESNLKGQQAGRGFEYFSNPQLRTWVLTVQFNR